MGTNNIISSNGKIFVVDEGCLGKPFIYRGDLTDEELRQWLYQIAHAIKCKNAPNDVIEEFRKEIGILESKRSDAERIVLENIYPNETATTTKAGNNQCANQDEECSGANHEIKFRDSVELINAMTKAAVKTWEDLGKPPSVLQFFSVLQAMSSLIKPLEK